MSLRALAEKARALGFTWHDLVSYAAIVAQRRAVTLWGTAALRAKAALFGVELGAGVTAAGSVILGRWPGSVIRLGAACSLISSSRRCTASTLYAPVRLRTFGREARIELGQGVELSGTAITVRSTSVTIGDYTMVGPNCVLTDSDFHPLTPAETRHLVPATERDAPVVLGRHVWLGMQVTVLKGVTIGEGSVIAAGSVVTRSIPPHCLAAGVPARVVRELPQTTTPSEKRALSDTPCS